MDALGRRAATAGAPAEGLVDQFREELANLRWIEDLRHFIEVAHETEKDSAEFWKDAAKEGGACGGMVDEVKRASRAPKGSTLDDVDDFAKSGTSSLWERICGERKDDNDVVEEIDDVRDNYHGYNDTFLGQVGDIHDAVNHDDGDDDYDGLENHNGVGDDDQQRRFGMMELKGSIQEVGNSEEEEEEVGTTTTTQPKEGGDQLDQSNVEGAFQVVSDDEGAFQTVSDDVFDGGDGVADRENMIQVCNDGEKVKGEVNISTENRLRVIPQDIQMSWVLLHSLIEKFTNHIMSSFSS